ncbi:MAG TPA: hypothetical protein PKY86_01515 [Niabella sp.]|nr:hypothetical protein [Niabella sp.]HQX19631.1 hypothetical protein [Niabella sp.]HRB36736.1 hypothetical protein [Niabella sp.]HRB65663.1 hypothetical protein [Niabella sp.]HRB74206.1 hypothetical protein [Niabella sp.]
MNTKTDITIVLIRLLVILILVTTISVSQAQEKLPWQSIDGLTGNEFKLLKISKYRFHKFAVMALPGVKFQDQSKPLFSQNTQVLNSIVSNNEIREYLAEIMGPVYKILENMTVPDKSNIVVIFNYRLAVQGLITPYFGIYFAATGGRFSETLNYTLWVPESEGTTSGVSESMAAHSGLKMFSIEPGINLNINPFNRVVFSVGAGYGILKLKQGKVSLEAPGRSFELEPFDRTAKQQLTNIKGGIMIRLSQQIAFLMEGYYTIPVTNLDNSRVDRLSGFSGFQFSF